MNKLILITLSLLCVVVASAQIKITRGPYLQNVKETEATIVWKTDRNSVGWVEIAPDDTDNFYAKERPKKFDSKSGIKQISQLHTVTLTHLKPGTSYRYRIYSQEVKERNYPSVNYGEITATDVYYNKPLKFTTNDSHKSSTSFVMLSDIHGQKEWITQLLEVTKFKERDIIIFNGDMVNHFTSENVVFDGFMNTSIELFAKEQPFYYVRGNHETRGEFASKFHDYFNQGESNLYYTVRQGPICFIILDTGEDKPDSDIEYGGLADFDSFRDEQAKWLTQVLESDDYKTAPFKIIVAHIPPAPVTDKWHGTNEVMEKFIPLLNKANADIMICGHLHEYLRINESTDINFPIIINSNNTVLKAEATSTKLSFEILDLKGKCIDKYEIQH